MHVHVATMINNNDRVDPVSDSTELVIQRIIEGIRRMIKVNNSQRGEGEEEEEEEEEESAIRINPAMKNHWELEIKTLRDAPRDIGKLSSLLKVEQGEYERAIDIEDIQRLVTKIEMLKFVLCLVSPK